jgi:hypothetical protein
MPRRRYEFSFGWQSNTGLDKFRASHVKPIVSAGECDAVRGKFRDRDRNNDCPDGCNHESERAAQQA